MDTAIEDIKTSYTGNETMALSVTDATEIVEQLQNAHRISVAFYRRILPTLDQIAATLGCTFDEWMPLHTAMPSKRKNSPPSDTWAWDYVPLFASNHIYLRTDGGPVSLSDVGLCLCLYVDDAIAFYELKQQGAAGQPDPISLPMGSALLMAYIYRPIKPSELSFDELWAEAGDPEIGNDQWQEVADNLQAICFQWPLAEVIQDIEPIISELKKYTC